MESIEKMIKQLNEEDISFKIINGNFINAIDRNGVTQTFYPSTGTIVLHEYDMKERGTNRPPMLYAIHDSDFFNFLGFLLNPELTLNFLKSRREYKCV